MFSSRKTTNASVALAYDPQFNYVTTLLHGDGTNGAQNNTFVDSSTNAYTITRNGNTTQGSFSPYGTLWSNYLNGSSDYLTASSNSAFAFGSGAFTVEFWIYPTATFPAFASPFTTGSTTNDFVIDVQTSGLSIDVNNNAVVIATSSIALTANAWNHVAVTRGSSGSTLYIFINGQQGASVTNSTSWTNTGNLTIGKQSNIYVPGYISNLRVVKGTQVYSSTFTPPTVPLTAITNTSLLTCQSNRFIDNSTNNFAITLNGTPSVQRFNPFLPTSSQAYSTSVYGGSAYNNASGDYLATPQNSTFNLSSGNWTIEGWFYSYSNQSGSNRYIVITPASGNTYGILPGATGNGFVLNQFGNGNAISTTIGSTLNAWQHVALVSNGGTTTLYINGVSGGTVSTSSWAVNSNTQIMFAGNYLTYAYSFLGYYSDCRVVMGTAVYTSNFTPPTAPLSAITNTQLLLSMQNAGIYDNGMGTDYVTFGNTQISTSVKKYGTGSLSFDGSTSYLQSQSGQNFIFYSGNWTIECWIYIASSVNNQTPYAIQDISSGYANEINIKFDASNNMYFYVYVNSSYVVNGGTGSSSALSLNTWYHHALVRNGTNISCYLNGVSTSSTTISSSVNISGQGINCILGGEGASRYFNGYIDDFRITKGYARYTSNFTPPTQALPNYGM